MPMNEIDERARIDERRDEVRVGHRKAEEQRADAEQEDGADEPVEDREDALPRKVHGTRERRHERVLDRPLPALPRDGLHEEAEEDAEVRPDDGADEQVRHVLVHVELDAARLHALAR